MASLTPEPRIRVLVVEDSRFMRGVIRAILAADPALDVVGTAADGLEAVEAVMALRPDVVTMDVD
ncbi:MAG: response regulator, partial [Candidatus Rokubacteria bacterium]|nr:response regulator [Candidatus Rokubacteria bacterium]